MELFGRIVDSINRKAVEKAKVTLYVGNEELAVRYSDNEGKFEHKEAAHYIGEDLTYKVEKDGYEPLESSTRIEGTKVLLKDIELVAHEIKFKLSFKDESHDPLENVKVTLEVGGEKVGEGFTSKDGFLKFSLSPELEGKRLSYKGEIADFEVASGEVESEKKTSREITMIRSPVIMISGKVEDQAVTEKPLMALEYQGIGIRFISLLIDSMIMGLIYLGIRVVAKGWLPWWLVLIFFIIYIGYFTYLEGSQGQTVGKMITKIKVVREDGKPIDMNQAFRRNILRIIDGIFVYLIGAILIWRSDKKQRLGDSIAKTVVVKA
jgi:uncharacterized RDD family membrane protein YckC